MGHFNELDIENNEMKDYCKMIKDQFTEHEIETSYTFLTSRLRGDRTVNQMVEAIANINNNSLPEWIEKINS